MDYEATKVVYVGNVSYVTLPNGIHISVNNTGKLDVIPVLPAGKTLQPYPYTGDSVPTIAAETTIENAIKLVLAMQVQAPKGA